MKIYIDDVEIGTTVSYIEENGKKQNLYVHDKEGFVFKSLKDKMSNLQQENEQLKKEIAVLKATVELKGHTDSDKFCIVDDKQYFEMEQTIRHAICEEIRNKAGEYWTRLEDDNEQLVDYYITTKDLDEILEKVTLIAGAWVAPTILADRYGYRSILR